MILFYYPLILLSILGYGFIASKKIIGIKTLNLGIQGLIGIFSLLIISYFSTIFSPYNSIQFFCNYNWTYFSSLFMQKIIIKIRILNYYFI